MFGRKRIQQIDYDRENWKPVLKCSICNGEQVAGFRDPVSGRFEELMLLRDDRDFQEFLLRYQVEESEIRREW